MIHTIGIFWHNWPSLMGVGSRPVKALAAKSIDLSSIPKNPQGRGNKWRLQIAFWLPRHTPWCTCPGVCLPTQRNNIVFKLNHCSYFSIKKKDTPPKGWLQTLALAVCQPPTICLSLLPTQDQGSPCFLLSFGSYSKVTNQCFDFCCCLFGFFGVFFLWGLMAPTETTLYWYFCDYFCPKLDFCFVGLGTEPEPSTC